MTKPSVARPAAPLLDYYWAESSRPLMSLAFIAPMLTLYEMGMLASGQLAVRSGADVWLRKILNVAGLDQYFLLPILTCGILLAWHHVRQDQWKIGWMVLYGMLIESILISAFLLVLGYCQHAIIESEPTQWTFAVGRDGNAAAWLPYLGAGIYEELLFRLILLPVLIAGLRASGLARGTSLIAAIALGSLLFAAAHYQFEISLGAIQVVNGIGDPFDLLTFSFRFFAGILFSLLFVHRGFGVAAGAHSLYDIFLACW